MHDCCDFVCLCLMLVKADVTLVLHCRPIIAVASYCGMIKLWQYRKRYVPTEVVFSVYRLNTAYCTPPNVIRMRQNETLTDCHWVETVADLEFYEEDSLPSPLLSLPSPFLPFPMLWLHRTNLTKL